MLGTVGATKMNETQSLPSRTFSSLGKISYLQVTIPKSKSEHFRKKSTDNIIWEFRQGRYYYWIRRSVTTSQKRKHFLEGFSPTEIAKGTLCEEVVHVHGYCISQLRLCNRTPQTGRLNNRHLCSHHSWG